MSKKVRKAVIPAAGFGTRFLPATKAMPKEMMPLVDKPIIQHVVEEAVSAGIEDVIIVTGWQKRSIEDHFDYPFELEKRLEEAGKQEELEEVRKIAEMANFIYVRQKGPMGNATPILNARHLLNGEPFLYLFADDFIVAEPSRSQQLIEAYNEYEAPILSAIRTTKEEDAKKYGFVKGEEVADGIVKVDQIIEKPGVENVPSDLAVVSGYVLTPDIFDAVEEAKQNLKEGEELVYVDALDILMKQGKPVYAREIKNGKYYDCGSKLGYLEAIVDFGLAHEKIGDKFREYLKNLEV